MRRRSRKKRTGGSKRERPRRGLTFGFFILVCLILAATGVFIIIQHRYAVSNELKVQKLDQRINAERAMQKSLRVQMARLKSPARVARIARDELGMNDPPAVIYLRCERDSQGRLVCRSSYELLGNPPMESKTGDRSSPIEEEETADSLTKR